MYREELYPLADKKRILEVSCGADGALRELLSYGAKTGLLHGIELLD